MSKNMAKRGAEQMPEQPRMPRNDGGSIAEIRYDDFLAAQRDPKVKQLLRDAKAESDDLKRRGLIHP